MEKAIGRGRSQAGRRRKQATLWSRFADLPTRAFLLGSLILGGAGLSNPLANWLIVALGLLVLAQRLPALTWSNFDRNARCATWLVLASASLCLLQMVPLPRAVWAAMPGREVSAQIVAAAGGGVWSAWSLAPDRTFDALTALLPIAAALLIAAQATRDERLSFLRAVLAVALAGAVLAVIQISAGPNTAPVLFTTTHRGFGVGFFVNRNHFALFLLVAMQIAALPGVPAVLRKVQNPRAAEWGLRAGALVLLALGVLSSLSRTGILLLPVALATAILLSRQGRVRVPIVAAGFGLAALPAFAMRATPPVQQLLARFATTAEDKRFEYWANTLDVLRDALPLGTGLSTFTLLYPTYEPLNEVYPEVVNHAHSDVLELTLEAGIPGIALLLAWLGFVAFACVVERRAASGRRERLIPLAVAIAVVLALAASLVDYPLRMHTIAVTLALLIGMLLSVSKASAPYLPSRPPWLRRGLVWAPALVLGLLTTSSQWGQHLARSSNEILAARVAPWSSLVQSAAATRYQLLGQVEASSRAARRALALAPLDAGALRAEGMAALSLGRREQGAALMSLGARLGWRDTFTQLWLAEQAMAAGAHGFAIQRIDAVLRQGKFDAELLPLLPSLIHTAGGRAALAEQLGFDPGWRVAFFNALARDRSWTMAQFLDLCARLRSTDKPVTEVDTGLVRAFLAAAGRYGDVRRVWQASGQQALVGDGGFEATGSVSQWQSPYGWYAPPLTGVRLDVAKADMARKGNALAITSDGLAVGGALSQTIVLPSGPHVLTFSARSDEETLLRQVQVSLGCRRDADRALGAPFAVPLSWRGGKHDDWHQAMGRFAVPDGCAGEILTLSIPQSGGRPFSIWIDDVSIRSGTPPGA